MNSRVLQRLQAIGCTLFRINLSHTDIIDVPERIRMIQSCTNVPICLDSEGAQVRTGYFVEPAVMFRENSIVRAHSRRVAGDERDFNFYPLNVIQHFEPGDFISIDFNSVLVQVIETHKDHVTMRVINGGKVGRNKAVTVDRAIPLDAMTDKDIAAVKIGVEMGIKHFALSFANCGDDVEAMRALTGDDAFIISKIECLNGLKNLDDIAERSNAILIDRGDLSREVPIERVPGTQKRIIRQVKKIGRKIYVATNLLETMVSAPLPTRAEVNDIFNTLVDGADGLVLAAETAIGSYPIECANMIVRMVREFENSTHDQPTWEHDLVDSGSMLIDPHGGTLVSTEHASEARSDLDNLPSLEIETTDQMDCEQFAVGTFSPLSGFMTSQELESVLFKNCLPSGLSWTLPIVLQIPDDLTLTFGVGDRIALRSDTGTCIATLDVSEIFSFDPEDTAMRWFGSKSSEHPGVRRLLRKGSRAVAGRIQMVKQNPLMHQQYSLTPRQLRFIFTHKGWSRVVGFHGRNPPHRAHTYIQLQALERSGADGLFINPVIGPQKSGDFLPEYVLKSYQLMFEFNIYPPGRVMLGSFSTYPRFCGPREAVFTALCRQNMGCSHFIVGRDHAGVGDFYGPMDAIKLFEKLPDVKIEPVFFDAIYYDFEKGELKEGRSGAHDQSISGTLVRDSICNGKRVPDWMMWGPLQDMLINEQLSGKAIVAE